MTIVRCPRCRDEVTAPAKASTKALVRCPLCLEEYPLADALASVPPALVVLGGDEEMTAAGEVGDEYQLSGGGLHGNGFAGMFDSSAPASAAALPSRPAVTAAPRPRKAEKNAVVELVKIVLGGIAGLAIGLVIMWWGLRQDPLELGPDVANYAPWLVPAQFHGKTEAADTEAAAAPRKSRPGNAAEKRSEPAPLDSPPLTGGLSSSAEPAAFDSGLLDPPAPTSPLAKLPEPALDLPLDLPQPAAATRELPPLDLPPAENRLKPVEPAAEEAPRQPPPMMPDLTDLLPDSTPPAELSPAGARPVPSAATYAQAVAAAREALVNYEGLAKEDAEARRTAFTRLFQAAGEVGRIATGVNPRDEELASSTRDLEDLLDEISGAKGSNKLSAVKFLAAQQWPAAHPDDGLLVAGMVKAVQPAGRLFEITLDASSRGELLLPVLTPTNPSELCATGDIVVIAGRVLDDPQQHLPGYEGQHSRVLLLGHSVRAPKVE